MRYLVPKANLLLFVKCHNKNNKNKNKNKNNKNNKNKNNTIKLLERDARVKKENILQLCFFALLTTLSWRQSPYYNGSL